MKRKSKQKRHILIAVLSITFLLVGCSSDGDEETFKSIKIDKSIKISDLPLTEEGLIGVYNSLGELLPIEPTVKVTMTSQYYVVDGYDKDLISEEDNLASWQGYLTQTTDDHILERQLFYLTPSQVGEIIKAESLNPDAEIGDFILGRVFNGKKWNPVYFSDSSGPDGENIITKFQEIGTLFNEQYRSLSFLSSIGITGNTLNFPSNYFDEQGNLVSHIDGIEIFYFDPSIGVVTDYTGAPGMPTDLIFSDISIQGALVEHNDIWFVDDEDQLTLYRFNFLGGEDLQILSTDISTNPPRTIDKLSVPAGEVSSFLDENLSTLARARLEMALTYRGMMGSAPRTEPSDFFIEEDIFTFDRIESANIRLNLDREAQLLDLSNSPINIDNDELNFRAESFELRPPHLPEEDSSYIIGFTQTSALRGSSNPDDLPKIQTDMFPLQDSNSAGKRRVYGNIGRNNDLTLVDSEFNVIDKVDFESFNPYTTDLVMTGAYIDSANFAHIQIYSRTGSVIEWIRPLTQDTLYVGEWDSLTGEFIPRYKRYYGRESGDISWFNQHVQGDNVDEVIKYAFASLLDYQEPTIEEYPDEEPLTTAEGFFINPPPKYISVLNEAFIVATNDFFLDPSQVGTVGGSAVIRPTNPTPPISSEPDPFEEPDTSSSDPAFEPTQPPTATDSPDDTPATTSDPTPYFHFVGADGEAIVREFTPENRDVAIKGRIEMQYAWNRAGFYEPINEEDYKSLRARDIADMVGYLVLRDETDDPSDNIIISAAIPLEQDRHKFDESWVEKSDDTNKSHFKGVNISSGFVWSFQFYTTKRVRNMPEVIEFYSDWGGNDLINTFAIPSNEANNEEQLHEVAVRLNGYDGRDSVFMKFGDCMWMLNPPR